MPVNHFDETIRLLKKSFGQHSEVSLLYSQNVTQHFLEFIKMEDSSAGHTEKAIDLLNLIMEENRYSYQEIQGKLRAHISVFKNHRSYIPHIIITSYCSYNDPVVQSALDQSCLTKLLPDSNFLSAHYTAYLKALIQSFNDQRHSGATIKDCDWPAALSRYQRISHTFFPLAALHRKYGFY